MADSNFEYRIITFYDPSFQKVLLLPSVQYLSPTTLPG